MDSVLVGRAAEFRLREAGQEGISQRWALDASRASGFQHSHMTGTVQVPTLPLSLAWPMGHQGYARPVAGASVAMGQGVWVVCDQRAGEGLRLPLLGCRAGRWGRSRGGDVLPWSHSLA